jgi:hypothetical protein
MCFQHVTRDYDQQARISANAGIMCSRRGNQAAASSCLHLMAGGWLSGLVVVSLLACVRLLCQPKRAQRCVPRLCLIETHSCKNHSCDCPRASLSGVNACFDTVLYELVVADLLSAVI